ELCLGTFVTHNLHWLGKMAAQRGDSGRAMALCEEAVELARQLGDKFGLASALGALMLTARCQDDHVRAAATARERLLLNREIRNRGDVVFDLESLAMVARAR